jgi:hypothetical protein
MKVTIIFVVILFAFFSCSKKDPALIQLLTNNDMETGGIQPSGWNYYSPTDSILGSWTTSAASSPTHSLEISRSTTIDSPKFGYWQQGYSSTIPTRKNLALSVKIKGANLLGYGAAIAIRTDNPTTMTGYALQFSTTQNSTRIIGTFDWTTYTVKLTNVDPTAKFITIYLLLLSNTTGTAYFDDANLNAE